jgi:hypothetical protein
MRMFRKLCFVHAVFFFGCTGDDITLGPDSGPPGTDATIETGPPNNDASPDVVGPQLLMTYASAAGEIADFNVNKGAVTSRVSFPNFGVVVKTGADYFLLEQENDIVAKLDPTTFQPVSTWSVALSDAIDGGSTYADPDDIVEVAPNKAYVLRYNRNKIAIIDPTQTADAGAPENSIDLSALVQAGDTDGVVEASGAVYDPSNQLLYVTLSNIDLNNVIDNGAYQLCGTAVSTLIAINTMTDALVSLGDAGPGGAVALNGVAPQSGYFGGIVYDAVGNRVLVLSTGCTTLAGDGGIGQTTGRLIEAVDLTANTTQTLLSANDQPYPGIFTYIDGAHALVQFGFYAPTTYQWIPSQTMLGPALPATPDVFDFDFAGQRILGPQQTYASDGGLGPMNVIAVPITGDAGATVLGQSPFLQTGGFEGNAVFIP